MELRSITINPNVRVKGNMAVVDGASHRLVFLSAIGSDSAIKNLIKESNKRNTVYIERLGNYGTHYKEYDHFTDRNSAMGYTTAVLSIKDKTETLESGAVRLTAYLYTDMEDDFDMRSVSQGNAIAPEFFQDMIYNKLYEAMPTPMIREWKSFIASRVIQGGHISELRTFKQEGQNFRVFRLLIDSNAVSNMVQRGLQDRDISINETNTVSDTMEEIGGMNDYLTTYSVQAANKLHDSFQAKFVPNESEYNENLQTLIDYASYKSGIDLYEPQKIVIQATANNLDKNDVSFIIATPGSGKTILGSSSTYAHHDKERPMLNIVMAPGHLVEKWISEIHKIVPLSMAIAVDGFEHFKSLEPIINDPKRRKHLYLVVSKDTVKSTYEKRPAVIWSLSKRAYTCACCGQVLQKKVMVGKGRHRQETWVNLTELDFIKEYAYNISCGNTVEAYDRESGETVEVVCGESLWTPSIKDETARWVRLSKGIGWVEKRHLNHLRDNLLGQENLDRNESKLLLALTETIEADADGTLVQRAPRKFSLANYIRRYYKGKIDYLIADELQKYKGGDSLQGQAFGDLVCAARKVICLTGTLLNGYANSLFYILYRAFPEVMKREGFDYEEENEFARTFGVVRYDDRFNTNNAGNRTTRIGSRKEKFLPGVSPLVFTKFLLENAVFLNLEDISDGLPDYQEIPVSVPMDEELARTYEELQQSFRNQMGFASSNNMKIMGSMLQTLSAYPDTPYDQPNVLHPDTGQTVVAVPELSREPRAKERELLRICRERVAAGEKVLVYYHWTNRTDVEEKLPAMLEEAGLRTTILKSNSSSMRDREAWIAERTPDTDVLLCNPTLVETGLDLLDYTSIIFYQVGYDIFTMRQASKRSYRLNQTKNVRVYFLYYENTIQEQALSLMATKLQASQAIEGNFSEEGLHAMSSNEDLLTQIANSVVQGIKHAVDIDVFSGTKERAVHSNPDASFVDTMDLIFEEAEGATIEEPVIVKTVPRIKHGTYTFASTIQSKPKKRSRKKPEAVSATAANTQSLLNSLRNKEVHIMQLA